MRTLPLLAVLLCAAPAFADDGCLFDGSCGPRPALAVEADRTPEPDELASDRPAAAQLSRWAGTKKGAAEGATGGFMLTLYPAVALTSDGFGRRMSSVHDGVRPDNANGELYMYAGLALAVVLYIPALVVGAVGGLGGGFVGAAVPDTVKDWDAESALFD